MHFKSAIEVAHTYWKTLLVQGNTVIDATCGNGHDTLFLANIILTPTSGSLHAMDLQQEAIENTRQKLCPTILQHVSFHHGCHSIFPKEIRPSSVQLIVYNLGYLPGGDKNLTTVGQTTLKSICEAQRVVAPGGMISITCYPGHPAGQEEEHAVLTYAKTLDKALWNVCHHSWCNRTLAPSLLILEKKPLI